MNLHAPFLFALALTVSAAQAEDTLLLKDGSRLRGSVRGIEANGNILIETEFASKPLRLRGEALKSINFEIPKGTQTNHPQLLHLVNGDRLPGTVTALDAEAVQVKTWYAGDIRIPRKFVSSIDYGVAPQKRLYSGPSGLANWLENDDWDFEDGSLVCDTSGTIGRADILPEQFILRFRIEWENSPNFKFYFCDDKMKQHVSADRYYFEVNSAGMQLKRQTAEGDRRWFHLAGSPRRPEEFPDRGFDVEIRVDRQNRLIYLYIDGEKLGRYPDPIDNFPTGTGIMLQSQAGGDMKNIVSRIEVYAWDAVSQLRRTEGHDDPKTDAVVDIDGEYIRGDAKELVMEDGKERIVFESPFAPDPLRIRTGRLSTLYFKSVGEAPKDSSQIKFDLRGGGKLRLATLALGEKTLTAEHPLLGKLELSREALKQLSVLIPEDGEIPDPEQ